jgi:hypothetical protein
MGAVLTPSILKKRPFLSLHLLKWVLNYFRSAAIRLSPSVPSLHLHLFKCRFCIQTDVFGEDRSGTHELVPIVGIEKKAPPAQLTSPPLQQANQGGTGAHVKKTGLSIDFLAVGNEPSWSLGMDKAMRLIHPYCQWTKANANQLFKKGIHHEAPNPVFLQYACSHSGSDNRDNLGSGRETQHFGRLGR